MSFSHWCSLLGTCLFWPTFLSWFVGYLNIRTMRKWACVAYTLWAVADSLSGKYVLAVIESLVAAWLYWLWKNGKDDDEGPKRRCRALRSKFDKVLPQPVTAPAPQAG